MFRRLLCRILGHRPVSAEFPWPELLVEWTYCARCHADCDIARH